MLAMHCRRCGAPVPLSLAQSDAVRCAFCDQESALPDDVAARLKAAGEMLSRHDASERQIRGMARLAVPFGGGAEKLYLGCAGFALLPIAAMIAAGTVQVFTAKGLNWGIAGIQLLATSVVAVAIAGTAFASLSILRKAGRRVAEAAAAVPPERPGEPVRCHVCGAPLEGRGVRGVARCDYCAADNVVEPAVLSRASARRLEVLEDYAAEVRRQTGAVGRAFGRSTLMLVTAAVLAPVLCGGPVLLVGVFIWALGVAGWAVVTTNQPPTPSNRYGLVEVTGEGRCVAWYNPYLERWERDQPRVGAPRVPLPAEDVVEVPLQELLGQRLRIVKEGDRDHGVAGIAEDPRYWTYTQRDGELVPGPDTVRLRGDAKGAQPRGVLWRLCLAEPDEDVP